MKTATMFIAIITMLFVSSVFAGENSLNITVKGFDQVEGYLVENELTHHNLSLSTPVTIEKGQTGGTFVIDGREEKIFYVKVTVTTDKGKFTGKVDNRRYPQLSGDEYYGLLRTALAHACQGSEHARQEAELDAVYSNIREIIIVKAKEKGYDVMFHRPIKAPNAFFYIDDDWCKVDYSGGVPAYSMVKDHTMEPVENLGAIFASVAQK